MINKSLSFNESINRIIHHEIGHWLICRELEFAAGNIAITWEDNQNIYGSANTFPIPKHKLLTVELIYKHMLDRMCVLCAGVITDIEWHKKNQSEDFDGEDVQYLFETGVIDASGLNDRNKMDELIYIMNGIKNTPLKYSSDNKNNIQTQHSEVIKEAWEISSKLLEKHYDKLFKMGDHLFQQFLKCQGSKIVFSEEELTALEASLGD